MTLDKQRWLPVGMVTVASVWCVWPAGERPRFDDPPKPTKLTQWQSITTDSKASPPSFASFFYAAPAPQLVALADEGKSIGIESPPLPFLNGNRLDQHIELSGIGAVRDRQWAIINKKLYNSGETVWLDNSRNLGATIREIRADHVVFDVQGTTTSVPLSMRAAKSTSTVSAPVP